MGERRPWASTDGKSDQAQILVNTFDDSGPAGAHVGDSRVTITGENTLTGGRASLAPAPAPSPTQASRGLTRPQKSPDSPGHPDHDAGEAPRTRRRPAPPEGNGPSSIG